MEVILPTRGISSAIKQEAAPSLAALDRLPGTRSAPDTAAANTGAARRSPPPASVELAALRDKLVITLEARDLAALDQFTTQISIADRPPFQLLRDNDLVETSFPDVITARTTGTRSISRLRARRGDDGNFAGIIGATIPLDSIDRLLATLDTGPCGHREITGVLLDLVTPALSGHGTFWAMREINPAVTVVLTSGFCQDEGVEEVMRHWGMVFLQKPYDLHALAQAMNQALRGWVTPSILLLFGQKLCRLSHS